MQTAYGFSPLPQGYRIAQPARDEAALRDEKAAFLAEELRHAWLTGADRVEGVCGTETLASVLGEKLGDADQMVVELVRKCITGAPAEELSRLSNDIVGEVGRVFGQDTAYILADRGLLS
jgi:hypothetical protein